MRALCALCALCCALSVQFQASAAPAHLARPARARTLAQVANLKTDVHFEPSGPGDRLALAAITAVRALFDGITGYKPELGRNSVATYLTRCIFLETVAGVPGFAGAMIRHFESLRLMRRDNGWIHTLIGEAENERMHLLTFLSLKKPSMPMRVAVLGVQIIFFNAFFFTYLFAPSTCHRFVGFLEEEAVRTYTHSAYLRNPSWEEAQTSCLRGCAPRRHLVPARPP